MVYLRFMQNQAERIESSINSLKVLHIVEAIYI